MAVSTYKKSLTKEQAWQKIRHFCAYQERAQQEAKEKLYQMGLRKVIVDELIAQLIEDGFLQEERFAIQYAGGHFRTKKWGKVKIAYALAQKKVSRANIAHALSTIDEEMYKNTLLSLATKKWATLLTEQPLARKIKTYNYLIQKGYEPILVQQVIAQILQ